MLCGYSIYIFLSEGAFEICQPNITTLKNINKTVALVQDWHDVACIQAYSTILAVKISSSCLRPQPTFRHTTQSQVQTCLRR